MYKNAKALNMYETKVLSIATGGASWDKFHTVIVTLTGVFTFGSRWTVK